jgi:Zn-dependent protease with chaperone function
LNKLFALLAALMFACAAHANPLVDKLVSQLEASPEGCSAVPSRDPQRQLIEADVARFSKVVAVPSDVHFDVMDCEADGFVYQGQTIYVSTRLARMNAAQRFFIIAHEMGHVKLGHHGAMRSFVAGIVGEQADESRARRQLVSSLSTISHQHELDADAFAVRAMQSAGLDPEQAARIFDSIGSDKDNATHPSARRRAAAIRSLALQR